MEKTISRDRGFMILVFLASLVIAFPNPSRGEPPDEIVSVAKQGLRTFLRSIPVQILPQFGFQDPKETGDAELGERFQVYTVDLNRVLRSDTNLSDLGSLTVPTNLWEFLILKDDQAKCILTVDFFKDQWTAVGIGSSGLAIELKKTVEAWPTSRGYGHTLIRINQAKSDFVQISKGEMSMGIIPLISARAAMGMSEHNLNPWDLHDPGSVLPHLIPLIKESLQMVK